MSNFIIRKMKECDRAEVLSMMRVFYDSDALIGTPGDDVIARDFDDCLTSNPFVDGYIFEREGKAAGYAMCAKSYTTERGGLCVWIEDLYIKEPMRHLGASGEFFSFIKTQYPDAVRFRLEAEKDNANALRAYEKAGFSELPYMQMVKEEEIK